MLFDLEGYEDDLDYRRLPISSLTPCTEALQLLVRKFDLPGKPCEYILVEVSEEDEGSAARNATSPCNPTSHPYPHPTSLPPYPNTSPFSWTRIVYTDVRTAIIRTR